MITMLGLRTDPIWVDDSGLMRKCSNFLCVFELTCQARRRGGSRDSNEPPLEVNNGGLKTQTVDFQLLANSGRMENKKTLIVLQ